MIADFQSAVMGFCTATAAYQAMEYWGAPVPLRAGALTMVIVQWVALQSLWGYAWWLTF